jgi:hypothetical protein
MIMEKYYRAYHADNDASFGSSNRQLVVDFLTQWEKDGHNIAEWETASSDADWGVIQSAAAFLGREETEVA